VGSRKPILPPHRVGAARQASSASPYLLGRSTSERVAVTLFATNACRKFSSVEKDFLGLSGTIEVAIASYRRLGARFIITAVIMSLFAWCSRRAGGLAMIATILLSYWVISKEAESQRHGFIKYQQQDSVSAAHSPHRAGAGLWTVFFAYYCLFIHVLVFIFPLRAIYSLVEMTRSLQKTARSKSLKDFKFAHRRRGSSSSETLTSSHATSSNSSEAGDIEGEFYTDADIAPDRVVHAIVIPNYKEEMDTLRETLEVLASHPQARNSYDVSLLACIWSRTLMSMSFAFFPMIAHFPHA
jgi:hypothetical protein